MKNSKTIKFNSKTENLKILRRFVAEFAKECGFSEKEIADIQIAVDEAATNIIKHAYGFDASKTIEASVICDNNSVKIKLKDYGKKFDPSKAKLPDIKTSVKLKKAGGLGIYLMKKLMDEVIYNVKNPEFNEIILIKKRGVK